MFDRYYRELLNFLSIRLRDRDAAADMTQESFARAYAAERAGVAIRDPRALLYKTARNLVIDGYRRSGVRGQGRAQAPDEQAIEPDAQAGPEALEPESSLSARQRFEAMAGLVDALPPRCREAFMLVKFDGLTHAQTAHQMGISVKTVEMQIQIALRLCWDKLAELDGETSPRAPSTRRGRKNHE